MDKQTLIRKILDRDRKILKNDFKTEPIYGAVDSDIKIIADFTDYSPLHLGHRHCMQEAKDKVPDGIFVAMYLNL